MQTYLSGSPIIANRNRMQSNTPNPDENVIAVIVGFLLAAIGTGVAIVTWCVKAVVDLMNRVGILEDRKKK